MLAFVDRRLAPKRVERRKVTAARRWPAGRPTVEAIESFARKPKCFRSRANLSARSAVLSQDSWRYSRKPRRQPKSSPRIRSVVVRSWSGRCGICVLIHICHRMPATIKIEPGRDAASSATDDLNAIGTKAALTPRVHCGSTPKPHQIEDYRAELRPRSSVETVGGISDLQ